MLSPAGPAALAAANMWWGMLAFFTLVWFFIILFWLYAMRPRQSERPPKETKQLATCLIVGGGILLPSISIVAILIFGIPAGLKMVPFPLAHETPLRIEVTGHQWYWKIHYPDYGITLSNELHIPVGQPVDIVGRSDDVIHSFWVPSLNGKIDLIPGYTNTLRLKANKMGRFRGQCAEFCGQWHARMLFWVMVDKADDFSTWVQKMQPKSPVYRKGAHVDG